MKRLTLILTIAGILCTYPLLACTSVIVSGKVTSDGRPLMFKHRDTGQLNNRLERFIGEKFPFVALVNSDWRTSPSSPYGRNGEAWSGMNSTGFCIMNTATYDLKDDDVPQEEMDREGVVMFRALEICATLSDFEVLLDTLSRPMGVEANFGVIDAFGGAAYYEVNNTTWTKFDVNDPKVAPKGYRVVTNFTQTGRPQDRKGVDRYEKASGIMENVFSSVRIQEGRVLSKVDLNHADLIRMISRSGSPILRDITSAVAVFEGVKPGDNPRYSIMWTLLGYPTAAVCMPVLVLEGDHIPSVLKGKGNEGNAPMCSNALIVKGKITSQSPTLSQKSVVSTCEEVEGLMDRRFYSIFKRWKEGSLSDQKFYSMYDSSCNKITSVYQKKFEGYLR